jgi:Flp pilus assembly protein CpaB
MNFPIERDSNRRIRSASIGWLVGAAIVLTGVGLAFGLFAFQRQKALKGWRPKPMLIASVDIEAGAPLTATVLATRSVPEQFVPDAAVEPSRIAEVLGERTAVFLPKGIPVTWSIIERGTTMVMKKVFFAVREIQADVEIHEDDLVARPMPAEFLTPSWIAFEEADKVVGRKALVSIEEGSPVLLPMVE